MTDIVRVPDSPESFRGRGPLPIAIGRAHVGPLNLQGVIKQFIAPFFIHLS